MIKYFVLNGADIQHTDKRGYSVLDYIVIMDNCDAAQYLLENLLNLCTQLTDCLQITLTVAIEHGSSKVARLLIDKMDAIGFESMLSGAMPFHAISCFRSNCEEKINDQLNLIKFLIGKINAFNLDLDEILAAKDKYEFMPLHLAIKNNNIKLAELLIKNYIAKLQLTGGPFGSFFLIQNLLFFSI